MQLGHQGKDIKRSVEEKKNADSFYRKSRLLVSITTFLLVFWVFVKKKVLCEPESGRC